MRTQTVSPTTVPRKPATPLGTGSPLNRSGGSSTRSSPASTTIDPLSAMMTRAKRSPSTGSGGNQSSNNSSANSSITGGSANYNQEGTSGVVRKDSTANGALPPIGRPKGTTTTTGTMTSSPLGTRRNSLQERKNLPSKRTVTEFGMTVEEAALERFKMTKKNTSPFDSNMFLPMLKPCPTDKEGKITLVLDIDETLVHSSLKPREGNYVPDTVVTITAGGQTGNIYVKYRPHLKTFLEAVKPYFEVVVFTASQSQYANQLMDTIDPKKDLVTDRLFREHCTEVNGARVKDLTLLGRSLDRMVILDNSPVAYLFQQRNAIPILSWFDDPTDTELLKLIPFLQELAVQKTVYPMLDMYNTDAQAGGSKDNSPSTAGLTP